MTGADALTRDYRVALLRYLPRGDEAASSVGYEIGRDAVMRGVGLLELVRIHQEIVAEVLVASRPSSASRSPGVQVTSCWKRLQSLT
jgi:hypothetical protein